ncbi:MAG: aminotransferase class I/II-fold pyridoxal phosphate-dependent enzyme, partial [archaeon]
MQINPEAEELNKIIKSNNPILFEFLSEHGKIAFMPKEGILAQSAQAKGKKYNATIGIAAEDDGTPMRLECIASKVALNPMDVFPYSSSEGKQELRVEWKNQMLKKNPSLKAHVSTPIITTALTHALSMIGMLFLNPNDTIITHDLYWSNYKLIFGNAYDAKIQTYNTFKNNGLDISAMEEKLTGSGKKILLLNFPNNPCGYSPTKEERKEIVNAIKRCAEKGSKILVILDDAYFGLAYEENVEKESLFSYLADIHP